MSAKIIPTFIGQEPFGVKIDESQELTTLVTEAKKHKDETFEQKLISITDLACGAMKNAYERYATDPSDSKARSIVFEGHSLSEALKEKLGCCRYQATLFLILGEAANLGKKHYLQFASVGGAFCCFNDVIDDKDNLHHVSIFRQTLSDKAEGAPAIFDRPVKFNNFTPFLAYTNEDGNMVRYAASGSHFDQR